MIAKLADPMIGLAEPHLQRLLDAAMTYQAAKIAVRRHKGPINGPDYAEKLAVWRRALIDLDQAVDGTSAVIVAADIKVEHAPAA